MKTLLTTYSEFSKMLLQDRIHEDRTVTYDDICAALQVSPSSLDEMLLKELGMNGREILYSFQNLLNL